MVTTYPGIALNFVFRAIYNAIDSDLPTLIIQMQGISMIYLIEGKAKYRIYQDHDIEGQKVAINYYFTYYSR